MGLNLSRSGTLRETGGRLDNLVMDEGYNIVAVERGVGRYNQEWTVQFAMVVTRTELEDVVLEVAQCSLDNVLHVEELVARTRWWS